MKQGIRSEELMIDLDNEDSLLFDFNAFTGAGSLLWAITILYRDVYVKKWGCSVPDPKTFDLIMSLYGLNEEYVIYHREHKKFGHDILEYSSGYCENMFCFFDFSSLIAIFEWYGDEVLDRAPSIPTYYALPSDRLDYDRMSRYWETR